MKTPAVLFAAASLLFLRAPLLPAAQPAGLDEATLRAVRSLKTAKIAVEQSYGSDTEDENEKPDKELKAVTLPFADATRKALALAGVAGTTEGTGHELWLAIDADGVAHSGNYIGTVGGRHFTGAALNGTITATFRGKEIAQVSFERTVPLRSMIHGSYRSPASAPFQQTFPGYLEGLAEMIATLYGTAPVVAALEQTADVDLQMAAAHALGGTNDPASVQALSRALPRSQSALRTAIAEALGQLNDARALPALIEALGQAAPKASSSARPSGGRMAGADPIPESDPDSDDDDMEAGFDDGEQASEPRSAIIEALVAIAATDKLDRLTTALRDGSSAPRRAGAATVLGSLQTAEAVEPLLKTMADAESEVRVAVARALGQLADVRAIDTLAARLADVESDVRRAADRALRQIHARHGDELLRAALETNVAGASAEALARALTNHNVVVRLAATNRLMQLQAWQPLALALQDKLLPVRRAAAKALSQANRPETAELLADHLASPDLALRIAAVEAAAAHPAPRGLLPLIALLMNPDFNRRPRAAEALGGLKDRLAVEPLLACIADADFDVRGAAVTALGAIQDARVVPPLIKMVAHNAHAVQGQVARALAAIGDPRAEKPLVDAFEKCDPHVREDFAAAVGAFGSRGTVDRLIALLEVEAAARARAQREKKAAEKKRRQARAAKEDDDPIEDMDDFEDENMSLADATVLALEAISGQKFETVADWRQWWKENRGTFVPRK